MVQGETYRHTALFEHRFWLQILGDHARFIVQSLAVEEQYEIQVGSQFIRIFDQLLEKARGEVSEQELIELNQQAYANAQQIRSYKLHLIKRQLVGKIKIHLSPSFINHMVNEVEEYIRICKVLIARETPPLMHEVHHHLLWLLDAKGHAASITSMLDMVEKDLKEKSKQFEDVFSDFYLKAVEMAGFIRTNEKNFPALTRFNKQVELEMLLFKHFLHELQDMGIDKQALGTLSPLMADHMAREECYYLRKLAQVSEVKQPNCSPDKPRLKA